MPWRSLARAKDGDGKSSDQEFEDSQFHDIRYSGYMENESAIPALGALAQSTRLDTFRLLVRHEPDGLAAGAIDRALDVPQKTMSAHPALLARAGLGTSKRTSTAIVSRADIQ